jgi:hypothetical protein
MNPILIIGMPRSGTTLVAHLLGLLENVHLEIEPHVLWKVGNFQYLEDSRYRMAESEIRWIRQKLLTAAGSKTLVEKSPVNSIRPDLVSKVFPEAKIVYVERDLVRCIRSNLKRSLNRDSFKSGIIFKKYFYYAGKRELSGAIGKRKLYQQLRWKDLPAFVIYALKMFWLRNVKNSLPFGPKLTGFVKQVKEEGYLSYHVRVAIEALKCKNKYRDLYGGSMGVFTLESIHSDRNEARRLYEFCGFSVSEEFVAKARATLSKRRIARSIEKGEFDDEIRKRLEQELKKVQQFPES